MMTAPAFVGRIMPQEMRANRRSGRGDRSQSLCRSALNKWARVARRESIPQKDGKGLTEARRDSHRQGTMRRRVDALEVEPRNTGSSNRAANGGHKQNACAQARGPIPDPDLRQPSQLYSGIGPSLFLPVHLLTRRDCDRQVINSWLLC
jgi:hypothetical protein